VELQINNCIFADQRSDTFWTDLVYECISKYATFCSSNKIYYLEYNLPSDPYVRSVQ
jgi:hypothetical protein